ncbi:MAG: DUF423 domain-containing protein [Alphaproteobacteria bacterium]|nr:DUF423 domain-containing protein [Alphaproteobacteria bacterium]
MDLAVRILLVLAGLFGAGGVATAAVAAHGTGDETLRTAAHFLLLHAAAVAATAAVAMRAPPGWPVAHVAGGLLALGTILFCGDLLARAWLGARLFPLAAPTGGSVLIAGWLALAVAGIAGR